MTITLRRLAGALVGLVGASVGHGQGPAPDAAWMACATRLRALSNAAMWYSNENGEFPPDLVAASEFLAKGDDEAGGLAWPELIRRYFISPGDPGEPVPDDAGPEWARDNSSYVYLGRPGLNWKDVPAWDQLAIAHLRLDRFYTIEPTALVPDGRMTTVAFLDGRVEFTPHAYAQFVVAESAQVWKALATGGPMPDRVQSLADLGAIIQAVLAYARAHAGELPPDLGAVLSFVADGPRTRTVRERARVFLSPRAQRNTFIPEDADTEWVNRNASYMYLGGGGVALARVADPDRTVLVHARPSDTLTFPRSDSPAAAHIPVAPIRRGAAAEPEEYARWLIGQSKAVLDSARTGDPLPDFQHAVHDLAILETAVEAYAKGHNGVLPPELAAVLSYIPGEMLIGGDGVKQRARVFLSPRAERNIQPPDELTHDWVRAHSTYTYLPPAGLSRSAVDEAGFLILLHAPLSETFDIMNRSERRTVAVAAGLGPHVVDVMTPDWVEKEVASSKAKLAELERASR